MTSDKVQAAGTVYLPGPSAGNAGISSLPLRFPWPLLHATWDVYRHMTGMRRPVKQGEAPVSQPGKACVMQVEGGGRTCGVPPSIRWTGKSGKGRAARMGEGSKLTAHRGSGDSPAARSPQLQARRTERNKSFRGDGGRETLFQKGPLPPAPKSGVPSAVPADA